MSEFKVSYRLVSDFPAYCHSCDECGGYTEVQPACNVSQEAIVCLDCGWSIEHDCIPWPSISIWSEFFGSWIMFTTYNDGGLEIVETQAGYIESAVIEERLWA